MDAFNTLRIIVATAQIEKYDNYTLYIIHNTKPTNLAKRLEVHEEHLLFKSPTYSASGCRKLQWLHITLF